MVDGYFMPVAKNIFGGEVASRIMKWFAGQGHVTAWRMFPPAGVEQHLVTAYRCKACGLLELYAR
jgi:hypothetical protein